MKRLSILLLMVVISFTAFAQKQDFEFYYISHDRTTPVDILCDRLEYVYENALSDESCAVIFYFPNYDEHIEVRINLEDDNRDDFNLIMQELREKNAHENYAYHDYEAIVNLINKYDFIDEDGNYQYSSVLFCWYVTPYFWNWECNEKLIAKLYFTLELDKYKDNVSTEIWHARDDGLQVDRHKPFGNKNLCRQMNFVLMPY